MKRTIVVAFWAIAMASAAVPSGEATTLWGLKSLSISGDPSRAPTRLYSFTPSGSFQSIANVQLIGTDIDADALALSPMHGLLAYELQDPLAQVPSGSRLVSIDTATATATAIGPVMDGREIRGAVFDFADRLWVIDSIADELLEIDPTSGTIIGNPLALSHPITRNCDIAVNSDSTFWLCNRDSLFVLDSSTGAMTLSFVDSIPDDGFNVSYAGMAFSGVDEFDLFLYDVSRFDDIFRYQDAAFSIREKFLANILFNFNAGLGDLASMRQVVVGIGGSHSAPRIALRTHPNPFNPSVTIEYDAPLGSPVAIAVFDLTGRLVRTLVDDRTNSGTGRVTWHGYNTAGVRMASGVYFIRLESGHERTTHKIVLLK